jgi:hypothetical protein
VLLAILPLPGFSLFIQVVRIVFIFMARDINAISQHTKKVLQMDFLIKEKKTLVEEALLLILKNK